MVWRDLVQIVPIIMFFVIVAGMFSVVLLPVSIEIYGTVTDNEGNPLNNVYMYVYRSDGFGAAEGGVDSQGRFSFFIHHYGEFEVWAEMPFHNYWWQMQKVKFESQDNNLRQRMDFQLIPDIPCNITLLASFWTVNSTHTSISFGYAQSGEITTLVEGIGPNYPYNLAVTYVTSGSIEGSGTPGGGRVLVVPGSISGSYSDIPGEVISCYVKSPQMGTMDVPAADYMSAKDASGGWIEELQPQSSPRELRIRPDRNYTLPDALSIPVDVDILGERFQTILPCTMLAPDHRNLSIWVTVTNLDSVPHSYRFFVEGGYIIHIWEIS